MSIIFPNRKCPLEKKNPLDVDGEPGRGYTTGIKFDIGLSKNRGIQFVIFISMFTT